MGRKLIEGFWDCKYCDTKRIRGNLRNCPNCGKARDTSTRFYLDASEKHYVPEEAAAKINRNPDWICVYCKQLNSDDNETCVYCGAPRASENLNYFQNKEKSDSKAEPVSDDSDDSDSFEEHTTSEHVRSSENTESSDEIKNFSITEKFKNFNFSAIWKPALIFLAILISFIGIFQLVKPKEYELTIDSLPWSRNIDIEQYKTVEESDWKLPQNARLLYTRQEYSHSEPVIDHYETRTREVTKKRVSGSESYVSGYNDLGNGYFEEVTSERPTYEHYSETETYKEPVYRDEPVYETKYYYEIDKWLYERSVETNGNNTTPYWGKTNLESDERISSNSEHYLVKGTESKKGKEISFSLPFEEWSKLETGQTVKVKITLGQGKILSE